MKIAVFRREPPNDGALWLGLPTFVNETSDSFLGYIDLPIEKPKEEIDNLVGRVTKVFLDEVEVKPFYVNDEGGNRISVHLKTPKKTVVKEAERFGISSNWYDANQYVTVAFKFPREAKNIKCMYEIKE